MFKICIVIFYENNQQTERLKTQYSICINISSEQDSVTLGIYIATDWQLFERNGKMNYIFESKRKKNIQKIFFLCKGKAEVSVQWEKPNGAKRREALQKESRDSWEATCAPPRNETLAHFLSGRPRLLPPGLPNNVPVAACRYSSAAYTAAQEHWLLDEEQNDQIAWEDPPVGDVWKLVFSFLFLFSTRPSSRSSSGFSSHQYKPNLLSFIVAGGKDWPELRITGGNPSHCCRVRGAGFSEADWPVSALTIQEELTLLR